MVSVPKTKREGTQRKQDSNPAGCQLSSYQPYREGGGEEIGGRDYCIVSFKFNKFEHVREGPCMVKSNILWVMIGWDSTSPREEIDTHD